MKFKVTIRETVNHYVEVEAPSKEQAWNTVVQNYTDDYTWEEETGMMAEADPIGYEPTDIWEVRD